MTLLAEIVPPYELEEIDYRQWIEDIEARMQATDGALDRHCENSPIKWTHIFTPGLYTRQIFMPKSALVVSRIHLHEHPFIISSGDVSVYDGREIVRYKDNHLGVTKPGTKRLLYCHEDTVWTTFHVTDKTTVEEVEEEGTIVCDSFALFDRITKKEITL